MRGIHVICSRLEAAETAEPAHQQEALLRDAVQLHLNDVLQEDCNDVRRRIQEEVVQHTLHVDMALYKGALHAAEAAGQGIATLPNKWVTPYRAA